MPQSDIVVFLETQVLLTLTIMGQDLDGDNVVSAPQEELDT